MGVSVVCEGIIAVCFRRVAFGPEAVGNAAHEVVLVGIQCVFVVKNIGIPGPPRRRGVVGAVSSLHGWLMVGGPSSPSGREVP